MAIIHCVHRGACAFALAAWSCLCNAQLAEIERYLRAEMALNEVPGLAIAIVHNNQVLLRAYGVRSLRSREPMTVDTPIELASVSKPLTAIAVMRLARAGKLELDWPAAQWLAELRGGALANVTVRDLLRHRSGLRRRHDRLAPCCGRPGALDLGLAARRLSQARTPYWYRRVFGYANSNYVLLAALVERVSGQPFGVFMEHEIFLPLGMTRTTVDAGKARAWGLAEMHERQWGHVRLREAPDAGWLGASLAKSTARDMAAFLQAALAGRVAGLERPQNLVAPYDLGWFVRREGQSVVLEHSGDTWGANAAVLLMPGRQLGVAVLINAGVQRAIAMARAIAASMLGEPLPAPSRPRWVDVADNWAMLFGGLAVLGGVLLAGTWARLLWQCKRGARVCGLPQGAWERARLLLLLLMACYLFYIAGRGVWTPVSASPPSLRIGLSAFGLVFALGLLTVVGLAVARPAQD